MNLQELGLGFQEKIIFSLRSLFNQYGYSQYKMSKFEEYDLYARNKDFLISDSVITFTDTNGKLMALKPDVTLSIVKNSKDMPNGVQKLYYNENVYRAAKGSRSFREIMQVGLECLGRIDDYCISEVLTLAAKSLCSISEESILDISHLGLLSALLDRTGIPVARKGDVLKCIGEKNLHELETVCREAGVSAEDIAVLRQLVSISGQPGQALPQIRTLLERTGGMEQLEELERIVTAVESTVDSAMLRIDFSVVDDIHYYNGIVFKGFIHGLPGAVLTGGQYDKLMQRMNRKAGAIGFAVYTDMLERLDLQDNQFDVDAVLLYEDGAAIPEIRRAADALIESGSTVMVQREKPENIRYKKLFKLCGGEVETLEDNA